MKVSQSDLANIFGVSTRTIRDWDKEGCPQIVDASAGSSAGSKKGVNAKFYETKDVIAWYVNREKGSDDDLPINDEVVIEAKRRQQMAKATEMEAKAMITQTQAGKLLEDVVLISSIQGYLMDFVADHKQQIDYAPTRIAHEIAACKTYDERLAVSKKIIDELSNHLVQIGDVLKFKNDSGSEDEEEQD